MQHGLSKCACNICQQQDAVHNLLTLLPVLLQEEFVVANELRIVSLDELEIEDLMVESEDTSVQTLRKPRWLQNKLHSLLGMGTTVTGRQDTPGEWLPKQFPTETGCRSCFCGQ